MSVVNITEPLQNENKKVATGVTVVSVFAARADSKPSQGVGAGLKLARELGKD